MNEGMVWIARYSYSGEIGVSEDLEDIYVNVNSRIVDGLLYACVQ